MSLPVPAETQQAFMQLALAQARAAVHADEVPIGAILVDAATQEIVAASHNLTRTLRDPTAHAEINVIREACARYGAQRIPECDLYVTLEPCPMCASALSFARIRHIFCGAEDIKSGGLMNGPVLIESPALHHKPGVTSGILAEDSAQLLKDFFKARR